MTNPTIDKLDAVLAARHPTEFRHESLADLSGRSPQVERWHKEETQWPQDKVDARRRRLRATSNRGLRSAERAAEAVAAGGNGRRGGKWNAGPQELFRAAQEKHRKPEQQAIVDRVRAWRKAAARAATRKTNVRTTSITERQCPQRRQLGRVSCAVAHLRVSCDAHLAAQRLICTRASQRALQLPRCKITEPRKQTSNGKDRRAVKKPMK